MPDVGVLELSIQDNSSQAAGGLEQLATALERVKNAVNFGRSIGDVARNVKNLGDALKNAISEDTITKLNQITDALSKLHGISNVTLNINIQEGAWASVNAVRDAVDEARESLEEFEKVNNALSTSVNINWTRGYSQQFENMVNEFMRMRNAMALGSGQEMLRLTGGGVAPENMLSTYVSTSGAWKPDWGTGSDWKPDWVSMPGRDTGGAIPVEGMVDGIRYAVEASSGMQTVGSVMADVATSSEEASSGMQTVGSVMADVATSSEDATSGMQAVGSVMENVATSSEEASSGMQTVGSVIEDVATSSEEATSGMRTVAQVIEDTESRSSGLVTALNSVRDSLAGMNFSLGTLQRAFRTMFPTLSSFISSFSRIARMRMLRAIIREIGKGISEGVENMYQYSKQIGSSFAPAMDSAAASLAQMKNSIGAMLAPVLQMLIPVLQTVVNWFITAVNYANQFFALMRGQSTWTRATLTSADAFDDVKKKATGAKNAIKDLLADWDELNIIQSDSTSSSGTGTKGMEDYLSMFEEVNTFDNNLKAITKNLKDQFSNVFTTVGKIGAAILGWKLSHAFAGLIGTIGGWVAAGAIIALTFDVSTILNNTFFDTSNPSYLLMDVLTTLIGGGLATKVLNAVSKGKLGKVAIPLTFAVSAAASIIALIKRKDVSALSSESVLSALNSALKGGFAAGTALYNIAGYTAGVSAGLGAGAALYTFGATIGIKATADVMDARQITRSTILADFISAGSIGAGLIVSSSVIQGSLTAATIATGGLGALFVFGALIGIQAIIAAQPKKIMWGDYNATRDEIKNFVEGKVFKVNANTILGLVNPKIQVINETEEALKATVGEVKLLAKQVTIGFDQDATLKDLETKIFGKNGEGGLIADFKATALAKQSLIETGITLVPTTGTDDDGNVKQILDESSEGWKLITGHMDKLGQSLSNHIATAYSESIGSERRAMELKTISEITEMMANVSAAITQGEAYEKSMQGLEANFANLTRGSFDDMFNYIEEYKKEVTSAYETTYDATTAALAGEAKGLQTSMKNALKLAGGDTSDSSYQEYKAAYDAMTKLLESRRSGRAQAIKDAADQAMDPETIKRIHDVLSAKIPQDAITDSMINTMRQWSGTAPEDYKTMYTLLFDKNGIDNGSAKETVTEWLDTLIEAAFPEDASTLKKAMEQGLLGYEDIIPQEIIDKLADKIGIGEAGEEVQEAWQQLIKDLGIGEGNKLEMPEVDNKGMKEGFNDTTRAARDMVDGIMHQFARLDGAGFSFEGNGSFGSGGRIKVYNVGMATNGGIFKSGDIFTANENGRTEMVGSFGHQTAVANNQQIVAGISSGVSQANAGVEARLGTIETMLNRILNKEFVAKAVPSSRWGEHGTRSSEQYSKVTGVY